MTKQCINLRETFGSKFKYDWAYHAALGSNSRMLEAKWLTIIPCKFGKIFPWGDQLLAAYCTAGSRKRRELAQLSCVEAVQVGENEVVVTFDVADFETVAAVMQPRLRRQYSPERREAMTQHLKRYRVPRRRTPEFDPRFNERDPCRGLGPHASSAGRAVRHCPPAQRRDGLPVSVAPAAAGPLRVAGGELLHLTERHP